MRHADQRVLHSVRGKGQQAAGLFHLFMIVCVTVRENNASFLTIKLPGR